jgi:thiol-disulfide isomerase/thioredoxin
MKTRYLKFFLNVLLIGLVGSLTVSGQKIEYIKTADLEKILKNKEDKLSVINFWATWCAPCVKELPHFEKISKEYDRNEVTFFLISLDFPSEIEGKLIPFLKKNKITHEVAVMTDTDYNLWIDTVDPGWQGNIPATLVINNAKKIRSFHPEELDEKQLRELINKSL